MGGDREGARHDSIQSKRSWVTKTTRVGPIAHLVPSTTARQRASNGLNLFNQMTGGSSIIRREIEINNRDAKMALDNVNFLLVPLGATIHLGPPTQAVDSEGKKHAEVTATTKKGNHVNPPKLIVEMDEAVFMKLCAMWDHDAKPKLRRDALETWKNINAATPRYSPPEPVKDPPNDDPKRAR